MLGTTTFIDDIKRYRNTSHEKSENTQKVSKLFEDHVKNVFINLGFKELIKDSKTIGLLHQVKSQITSGSDVATFASVDNQLKGTYILQQPRGSQKPPDLLLLDIQDDVTKFQCVEVKYGATGRGTYNNTHPKKNWVYIFTDGLHDATLFIGADVIHEKRVQEFKEYKSFKKLVTTVFNKDHVHLHVVEKERIRINLHKYIDTICDSCNTDDCSDWMLVDYFKFEHRLSATPRYIDHPKKEERERNAITQLDIFMGQEEDEGTTSTYDNIDISLLSAISNM